MRNAPGVLLLLVGGCPSRPALVTADAGVVVAASIVDAAHVEAPHAEDAFARSVVARWNDALDRHDPSALAEVYAPKVVLYGDEMKRATAIEVKTRAFKAAPAFRQSLVGEIMIEREGGRLRASFKKRTGVPPKQADVPGFLYLIATDAGPSHLLVSEEWDDVSYQKRRLAGNESTVCEIAADNVVNALPAVRRALAGARAEIENKKLTDRRMGELGPIPDEGGGFSGSLGVHHADRYEALVWYGVKNGVVTVTVMGADVPIPPAAKADIERACPSLR